MKLYWPVFYCRILGEMLMTFPALKMSHFPCMFYSINSCLKWYTCNSIYTHRTNMKLFILSHTLVLIKKIKGNKETSLVYFYLSKAQISIVKKGIVIVRLPKYKIVVDLCMNCGCTCMDSSIFMQQNTPKQNLICKYSEYAGISYQEKTYTIHRSVCNKLANLVHRAFNALEWISWEIYRSGLLRWNICELPWIDFDHTTQTCNFTF